MICPRCLIEAGCKSQEALRYDRVSTINIIRQLYYIYSSLLYTERFIVKYDYEYVLNNRHGLKTIEDRSLNAHVIKCC